MSDGTGTARVLCLGEALVDFVCPEPVANLADASEFVPMLGGSLANVAAVAARFGAEVAFTGGAGDDDWGRWLRERLADQGVDVDGFVLAPGTSSLAFVAVSAEGEPSFAFYEASQRAGPHAWRAIEAALDKEAGVFVFGSDTLFDPEEREVTLRAAGRARDRGWTVLADPNLRPARWTDPGVMEDAVGQLIARAHLLKCNGAEARRLTGSDDEGEAARELLVRGPRAVVVTMGAQGALVASGAGLAAVPAGETTEIVDATGAGDSVTGVLAAALAAGAPSEDLESVLMVGMRTAAGVVAQWGSVAGLPEPGVAEERLVAAMGRPGSGAS